MNNKTIFITFPFYYYDVEVLKQTLDLLKKESDKYGFIVHYATKANANNKVLDIIRSYGLGADCVSGNEIKKAIECKFNPNHIVLKYANVLVDIDVTCPRAFTIIDEGTNAPDNVGDITGCVG